MTKLELAITQAIKSHAKHYKTDNTPLDYIEGHLHGVGYDVNWRDVENIAPDIFYGLVKEGLYK